MSRAFPKLAIAPVCASLALACLTVGAASAPAAYAQSTVEGDTGSLIAQGVVLDHGSPVAGATVAVFLNPSAAILKRNPKATQREIDVVHAASNGSFSVYGEPSLLSTYADANGNVSFEVAASTGSQLMTWTTSVKDVPASKNAPAVYAESESAPAGGAIGEVMGVSSAKFAFGTTSTLTWGTVNGVGTSTRIIPSTQLVNAQSTTARTTAVTSAMTPLDNTHCNYYTPAYMGHPEELFGHEYTQSWGTVSSDQSTDSEDSLGVESEYGGGTVTITMGDERIQAPTNTSNWLYNEVNYWAGGNSCIGWQDYPTNDYSLLTRVSRSTIKDFRPDGCSALENNGQWIKHEGSNVEFSAGVQLGAFDLSAHAGYNSRVELFFVAHANTQICGTSSQGPAQSPDVAIW